jgi:DNA-binding ferritin-like protein
MRIPITLSERAVRDAKAYMANNDAEHAVESLIDSYGNLVADIRKLRARVGQLDDESAEVDAVVGRLREIAKLIEEL